MRALRIPSLRRLNKNPDGLGALVIIAAAGAGLYFLSRKKKTTPITVIEPSGAPIVERGFEGSCQWTIRTEGDRFGYWVVWKTESSSGGRGTRSDEYETEAEARVDLGDQLVQLRDQGLCG